MAQTKLDGITTEIIRCYLSSAAEEMRRTLIRTAFHPVIYDVLDFGISIYNAKTELIAEAAGLPMFIGASDYALKEAVKYVGIENLDPGDILIMNYPYWNSAHTQDITLFAPIFDYNNSELIAFGCIRAHWQDIGAKDPGYVLDSTDMHQEGIVFPGTKVFKKGEPNHEILEIIRFNSRMPDFALGDLHAQVASIRTGERRLQKIFEKFGKTVIDQAIERIMDHGEKASLQALANLPHGTWSAVDYIDDDGITDDMIKMMATVTITEKDFTVDLTGSSNAVKGPVNVPFGASKSMCRLVFKAVTTPHLPSNSGNYRPLKVIAPPGTLFHAVYPSPTFTLWTTQAGVEVICKAIAKGNNQIVSAASGGEIPGIQLIGKHPDTGQFFAVSNNEVLGWGGTATHDGANAVENRSAAAVRNYPVEKIEIGTSSIIEKLELCTDSGGPGKFRGGLGVRRDIQFTADGEILSVMKKSKTGPWGLAGGHGTEPNGFFIFPGTDREKRVGTYRAAVTKGDRCYLKSAGGGGYGNPKERDPKLVLEDVLDEYVSIQAARSIYGVEITDDEINWKETKRLRGEY